MLSLAMSVIASMISVAGLGRLVLVGISQLDLARASVGGLGIVLLAIVFEPGSTQGFGFTRRERNNRGLWEQGPVGWLRTKFFNGHQHPKSNREDTMKRIALNTALAALTGAMLAQAANAAEVTAISTGRTDHQLIYEVIEEGLAALGYENGEMLTGNYPAIHLSLGQGDAHYTAVHWKPLHDEFYANSGGDDALVRAGPLYEKAMQAYFIDKKTAEKHGINALEQMKDPAVAAIFDTDGDGQGQPDRLQPGLGMRKGHRTPSRRLRPARSRQQRQGRVFCVNGRHHRTL